MAQEKKSISFKNAVIDMRERTITEFLKDEVKTYDLDHVLSDWEGIDGINFTIQQTTDLQAKED